MVFSQVPASEQDPYSISLSRWLVLGLPEEIIKVDPRRALCVSRDIERRAYWPFMPRAWLRARSGAATLDEEAALAVKTRPSIEPRSTVTAKAECHHGIVALFSWDYDGNLVDASRKRRARSSAQAVLLASSAIRSWRISNSTCGFPRRSPSCT